MLIIGCNQTSPFEASYNILKKSEWKAKTTEIFIKPNIGATSKFVNTDPEIVRGIIQYCKRELNIHNITIGEGSVETEYESTSYNFHHQGWDELASEENVELIDLNKIKRITMQWYYGRIPIPKVIVGKTYINVAKMKTHMQTIVTLCTKNQKGLLNSSTRKLFHKLGLHEPIAHFAEVLKPELCVIDGIVAIEGNGPGEFGIPRKDGLVIIGDNMLQVDKTCCRIMGINPDSVQHLRHAKDCQEKITLPQICPFKLPNHEFKMFNVHMRPENACSGCISSVGKMCKITKKLFENPFDGYTYLSFKALRHFLGRGILKRLDIVVGNPKELPENHGEIIFYGDCSSEISKKYPQYPLIKGCPPESKKALEELVK